jgi:dTDP-4-amino-4,6-dideoxygalactose transaminase
MYYVLLSSEINREDILDDFKRSGISSVFHYVPLHSSPAGQRYGREGSTLTITYDTSERLIRLPLWVGMSDQQQDKVVDVLQRIQNHGH